MLFHSCGAADTLSFRLTTFLDPGWQVVIAWLLAVAVAGVIYFVPVTQLVDNLSDHPTTAAK